MNHGSCSNCAFFDHHQTQVQQSRGTDGLCRFNPPISQPGPTEHGLWPVVSGSDWCGHFSGDVVPQTPAE